MKNSSEQFNRDYYENGIAAGVSCYTDYRWLPEMTIPMAHAIVSHLGISHEDKILDYGCAKGFLVKALRMLGYQATGVDVSAYAVAQADDFTRPFLRLIEPGAWLKYSKWIIAKDVLEHLTEDEIRDTLRMFSVRGEHAFIVVPLGDGERFTIPEMERDVTHKTRQTAEWWEQAIADAGFSDVQWSHSVPGIKEKWTSQYPTGNGFFTAR